MAEDKEKDQDQSQKTEEPTAHRLEKAREEGNIPLSREVNHGFVILGATIAIAAAAPQTFEAISKTISPFLLFSQFVLDDPAGLLRVLSETLKQIAFAMMFPILALMLAGLVAGFAQTKFLVTSKSLKPKFEKISPFAGFKRLFSQRNLVEFTKGLLKILIVGAVCFGVLFPYLGTINRYVSLAPFFTLLEIWHLIIKLFVAVVSIVAFVAVIDYLYQRFAHIKKLRMSKQEIKDEYKHLEGDPKIKQRIADIRAQRARARISERVPKATAVIVNPTHYAVAIEYDSATMRAPIVCAKGVDFLAQKIKEIAKENDVPIFENPPLARALYGGVEIDHPIPAEHYEAVAKVIRYIMGFEKHYNPLL